MIATEATTNTTPLESAAVDSTAISAADVAEASSAHARINVPLNLENWRTLPMEVQAHLLWFHQHALDQRMSWESCQEALGYDKSTIFRVLKGDYNGSWNNIVAAIKSYRKLAENRARIQVAEFAPNSITNKITEALDYALAAATIVIITGESRMGKTATATAWRDANNHGRSVLITAPAYGSTKSVLRDIARAVGVNRNLGIEDMKDSVYRAFNRNRILIVDEAHLLLPGDRRSNPVSLEFIRQIHDRTGCALALLSTCRFDTELRGKDYMYEQLLGRALLVRLPKRIKQSDIDPIIRQYIKRPSQLIQASCMKLANDRGRMGVLIEVLRVASDIAARAGSGITEDIVLRAIKERVQREMPE